jgi:hypothetical protein
MSKFALTFFAFAVCAAIRAQPPGGFRRGAMMHSPAFQALDADHDGVVSAAELKNAPASLKTLDKNSDGKLTGG